MYKIYTDKTEEFNCKIQIEGAELNDSKVRLIIEGKDFNLLFNGNIDGDGKCTVNISKVKMLSEGLTGKIKLEVIADDTFFTPWEDNYIVETSKKVVVEVESKDNSKIISESKPKVKIERVENIQKNAVPKIREALQKEKICFIDIKNQLVNEEIDLYNLKDNKLKFKNIVTETIKKYALSPDKQKWLSNNILKFLSEE